MLHGSLWQQVFRVEDQHADGHQDNGQAQAETHQQDEAEGRAMKGDRA
jgi:hypothetical protein